ncbi:MAG TPA: hypothetical protein VFG02_05290 [Nitrospirota bacterium]|nr:hypothetical protein [Nitrospirota bacterium]
MKKVMSITMITVAVMLLGAFAVHAGEKMGAPVTHSKDFVSMKELVGVWEGKADMGKGMETLRITYESTSAGNAIVERFGAGKPHEMVTVYYDYGGKLTMTHYCSLGNQPHMELSNPGEANLMFILSDKIPGLVSMDEMHMHALTMAVDGKDSITQTWTLYDKGAKKSDVVVKLSRVKI